jgi:hypothetical protein
MRCFKWFVVAVILSAVVDRSRAGDPVCCEPPQQHWLARIAPVGGWHPDSGGLLHWYDYHAFPRGGAPDDYLPKKLPPLCWPPYRPVFQYGPPEVATPCTSCEAKKH